MVINDFVSAMQSKDHEALAACFAEECRLFDYCPSVVKRQNSFLFGRNAIEMYYHNKFMFGGFGMLDPRVVNERTVNFYADYNGTIIHALAQIENCTDGSCSLDDSLIRELVIANARQAPCLPGVRFSQGLMGKGRQGCVKSPVPLTHAPSLGEPYGLHTEQAP